MSKDGYLPDGVTHQMIDAFRGGPEDEGVEIDLFDGRIAVVCLLGEKLAIEIFSLIDDDDRDLSIDVLEFDLGPARVLSQAISERVM